MICQRKNCLHYAVSIGTLRDAESPKSKLILIDILIFKFLEKEIFTNPNKSK